MNALGKSIYQCLCALFVPVACYSNKSRILVYVILFPVLFLKVELSSKFQKPQTVQAKFYSPVLPFDIVLVCFCIFAFL